MKALSALIVLVMFGFGLIVFTVDVINSMAPEINQLTTTSGDDVIICMRGKVDKLVYINGHLFDCVPMADHRSVKLYLRGK